MKALIISADNFEDSELLVPYYRLREAGIEVEVAAPGPGKIKGKHGYEVAVDRPLAEIDAVGYDLLILPGGKARNKPVAAICHGPQTLISAGLLGGRRATCYRTVADELRGAGALYEDSEVVVDGNLVTSRQPADLPAFMREIMKLLE